ncbi:BZ3500_MvSof-1268-A1-R1_Chr3-1g06108 [Microbotryum saponariae]|uniref:Large ribosomal subunit protein bL28m n=1 Tax=Microbotryum saponariae TaxID=289078 RepID=A0A2X0LAP3_9BASI|nr:BZ3500_MvSof-1268-A1-R1_Chr3-1g06108 [Microbotryum saponariae]SDA03971.1 BZ3501_MvSof-1269-A2-R1_Chr3-2g05793 [Microbotryum saponariae]
MFPTLPLLRGTSRSSWLPKRFQTGLYDGRSLQSGSSIGETFSSKTRRRWLPNVQTKRIYSESLKAFLKLKVTTGALRTMDKCGGLDQYLFRMKQERLGKKGLELRQMVSSALWGSFVWAGDTDTMSE